MTVDAMRTARDILAEAERLLRHSGIGEARREVSRLAEAAWGLAPGQARLRLERFLGDEEGGALLRLARRRATGEPLAYVTGTIGFRHLVLGADRRALIPRPETEGLVELVLARVRTGVVADVCTGSGCVALALAAEGAFDRVIGTDADSGALALAGENAVRTGLSVAWRQGDFLTPLAGERLDALVANPPYLTESEFSALDPAVSAWEPALALVSGPDGLEATRRILEAGRGIVKVGGWIALEVDCQRAEAVVRLAAGSGWLEPSVHQDPYDRDRYVLARRSETS